MKQIKMKQKNLERTDINNLFNDNNEENVLSELFEKEKHNAYLYLKKKFYNMLNHDDIEDVISNAFIKFIQKVRKDKNINCNFFRYFTVILKRTAIDYISNKRKKFGVGEYVPLSFFDIVNEHNNTTIQDIINDEFDLEEDYLKKDIIKSVLICIRKIQNEDYKKVLFYRISLEESYESISKITGQKINTLKSNFKRGVIEFFKNFQTIFGSITEYKINFFENAIFKNNFTGKSLSISDDDFNSVNDIKIREILIQRFKHNNKITDIAKKYSISVEEVYSKINEGINYIMEKGMERKTKLINENDLLKDLEDNTDEIINKIKKHYRVISTRNISSKESLEKRFLYFFIYTVKYLDMKNQENQILDFGSFLDNNIKKNNINYDWLCSKLFIKPTELIAYINNTKFPDINTIKKLSEIFNVDVEYITDLIEISK